MRDIQKLTAERNTARHDFEAAELARARAEAKLHRYESDFWEVTMANYSPRFPGADGED
jgi:hypothetical protein